MMFKSSMRLSPAKIGIKPYIMLPINIFGMRSIFNNCSIRRQIKAFYKVTLKSKLFTMSPLRNDTFFFIFLFF